MKIKKKIRIKKTEVGLDADYEIDEYKFDEQLVDTDLRSTKQ